MNGHDEELIKIEKDNQRLLQGKPPIIRTFYNSLAHLSSMTKKQYLTQIVLFFNDLYGKDFSDADIIKVTGDDVGDYMTRRQTQVSHGRMIGKGVMAMQISALNKLYTYLLKRGTINRNPIDSSPGRPKVPEKNSIVFLEYDEIQQVLKNIDNGIGNDATQARRKKLKTRDKAMFLLFIYTGIRRTALANLNVEDYNRIDKTIKTIDKGNVYSTFDISYMQDLISALDEWLLDREKMNPQTPALFISNRGQRISVNSIADTIRLYTSNIDKHISPHKLRSTFATNYYRATDGDILLTKEAMRHRSVKTTQKYAVPDRAKHKDAMLSMASHIQQKE